MAGRSSYETKGFAFKGLMAALAKEGMTAQVRAKVTLDIQLLMDAPPVAGAWIPGWQSDAVSEAAFQLYGEPALRKVSKAAIQQGAFTVIRPVVDSVVRVAGVSPAGLLAQLGRLSATTVKGLEHRYEPTGDRSGFMHVTVAGHPPASFFIASAGSLEVVFDVCGLRGSLGNTVITPRPTDTLGCHEVRWDAAG